MTAAPMNRRTLLRGTSGAIAVAAVFAVPAAALASPTEPDAALLTLDVKRQDLEVRISQVEEQSTQAFGRLPEWAKAREPKLPDAPLFQGMGRGFPQGIPLEYLERENRATEEIVSGWRNLPLGDPERQILRSEWIGRRAEGRQRVKWWHEQAAAIADERRRAGVTGLQELGEQLVALADDIEGQIHDTPAAGLVGIAIKLRLSIAAADRGMYGTVAEVDGRPSWQKQLALSALCDAERLAETGGAA